MFSYGMIPRINEPTRATRYTPTSIYHMITNYIMNTNIKLAITKEDISDHFPVLFVTKFNVDVNIKTEK